MHTSPSNFCLRNGKAQAHASAARCYQLIMQFFELTLTYFLSFHCCDFFFSEKQNLLCQSAIIVIIDLLLVLKGVFLKNSIGKTDRCAYPLIRNLLSKNLKYIHRASRSLIQRHPHFCWSVNPMSTRGQIMPTTLLLPPPHIGFKIDMGNLMKVYIIKDYYNYSGRSTQRKNYNHA